MAGNWKMNVNHLEAIALVQKLAFALNDADFDAVDVAVIPPFTDLRSVQTLIDGDGYRITYGAQDLSVHDSGAFTGEISGAMLAKLGCTYVLVGHSERREYHAEGDDVAAAGDDALADDRQRPAARAPRAVAEGAPRARQRRRPSLKGRTRVSRHLAPLTLLLAASAACSSGLRLGSRGLIRRRHG
jgi:hypothetical protein